MKLDDSRFGVTGQQLFKEANLSRATGTGYQGRTCHLHFPITERIVSPSILTI
jgi:hypothetical protein